MRFGDWDNGKVRIIALSGSTAQFVGMRMPYEDFLKTMISLFPSPNHRTLVISL